MDYVFNLCVDMLVYLSDVFKVSYEEINVIIFCIAWPILTIFLIYKAYFNNVKAKI